MNQLQKDLIGRVKVSVDSFVHSSNIKEILDIILANNGYLVIDKKLPLKKDLSVTLEAINDFIKLHMVGRAEIWYAAGDSRETLSVLISSFFSVNPTPLCQKCSNLAPDTLQLGDKNCVRCLCCGIPVHTECYYEINPKTGIFYICSRCQFDTRRHGIHTTTADSAPSPPSTLSALLCSTQPQPRPQLQQPQPRPQPP